MQERVHLPSSFWKSQTGWRRERGLQAMNAQETGGSLVRRSNLLLDDMKLECLSLCDCTCFSCHQLFRRKRF